MVEQGYITIVTAAQHADGTCAAYSLMLVSRHLPTELWQDLPDRRRVHTCTAEVNGPMQRINETFGFRAVEQMHEYQRVDMT